MHNWNTTSLLETDQNKQVLIALLSVYIQCNAIRLLISSNQLFAHPPPQLPDSHCESVVITTAQRRFVLPRDEVHVLSTALINVSGRDCVTFFSFLALMRPFAEEQRGHGVWVSFQTLQFFRPLSGCRAERVSQLWNWTPWTSSSPWCPPGSVSGASSSGRPSSWSLPPGPCRWWQSRAGWTRPGPHTLSSDPGSHTAPLGSEPSEDPVCWRGSPGEPFGGSRTSGSDDQRKKRKQLFIREPLMKPLFYNFYISIILSTVFGPF